MQSLIDTVDFPEQNYKEMKYDDFKHMSDVVTSLWDFSKQSREMEIDGESIDKGIIKEELMQVIQEHTGPNPPIDYTQAATKWEDAKIGLMGFKSSLRRVESWVTAMDGSDKQGVFRKFLWTPISEAADQYRSDKNKYMLKFKKLTESVSKRMGPEEINSPEVNYKFKDRGELLGALLHVGNPSNKRKLLLGRNWATDNGDGTMNTSKWDSFIKRLHDQGVLQKEDWDYIQSIWD